MNSRMDKYNSIKPTLKKRTEKNKDLYAKMYDDTIADDFDVNSNMTVLNTDSRVIDVDKIRDMLDRKYRVDEEKKHLVIPEDTLEEVNLVDTKEYDINSVLEQKRKGKNFDYEKERLKSIHNTQYEILKKLDLAKEEEDKTTTKKEDEENLVNLINTITALELKNKEISKKNDDALDLLSDLKDDEDSENEKTPKEKKREEDTEDFSKTEQRLIDVDSSDFNDFEELQKDIKSNSILIKIVSILFVLILLLGCLILANNYFDLGLF